MIRDFVESPQAAADVNTCDPLLLLLWILQGCCVQSLPWAPDCRNSSCRCKTDTGDEAFLLVSFSGGLFVFLVDFHFLSCLFCSIDPMASPDAHLSIASPFPTVEPCWARGSTNPDSFLEESAPSPSTEGLLDPGGALRGSQGSAGLMGQDPLCPQHQLPLSCCCCFKAKREEAQTFLVATGCASFFWNLFIWTSWLSGISSR